MPENPTKSSKHVLEPVERISEVLSGLIMVLTFTSSLSAARVGQGQVRTMLIGALGCNLAWGIIDGVFYLMGCLSERARSNAALRALSKAADAEEAQGIIAEAIPPALTSILPPVELQTMRYRLSQLPAPPPYARLTKDDLLGALGIFSLVFLSTFPPVIPFIFTHEARMGLRVSNGVTIVMLFLTGYAFGRYLGRRQWLLGLSMVVLGLTLVGIAIALGG